MTQTHWVALDPKMIAAYPSRMEIESIYENASETASGQRIGVQAARIPAGGEYRGGILVTIKVPGPHTHTDRDGSVTATITLNPGEGLVIADWLREAFHAADRVGPELYPDT